MEKDNERQEEALKALEDEALVERCQAEIPENRTEAFHEILTRYEGMVYHTCLRMLGDVQEAEESSQDVFLRVYRKIHQFEGRSTFKTWLFRVVTNICMSRRRNLATRRERGEAIESELILESEISSNIAATFDLSENVRRNINRLKPDDREVIILRFMYDLNLEEIAETLDLGLSAAKMRLYRAMERFKLLYQTDTEGS